jgi:hypothetical protein
VINVNIQLMNVNQIHVQNIVIVLIYQIVIHVFVVRGIKTETKKKRIVYLDPGWTGIDCSEDIDECKMIQPCKAARACINLPGTYKCDCLDSFGGQNCEMV